MGGNRRFGTVAAACTLGLLLGGASVAALAASGDSMQIAQSAEQTAQNYFYAGFEALQQNRLQEAVSMFEGGLQYSPNNAVATYYLALSYDRMASYERAAQLYQRTATLAPGTEEGRNAQERLRTMSATVPSVRPYAEAPPPEPASRSIREVFEQSAAGQASRQPEPQRNVQLPPPPVGRGVPPALPPRQAAAPQVSVPPYVAAPPAPAAPARRLESPEPRAASAPPATDAASRFSMFDASGGGTGRVASRLGVERPPIEAETSSASSALPLPQPTARGQAGGGASEGGLRMPSAPPVSTATSPVTPPAAPTSAEGPESSDIIWSTGGGATASAVAAEPQPAAMPSQAPSIAAPRAAPAAEPQPSAPLGNLVAELPKRSSTADLNARALQFVADRDGVSPGGGPTPSTRVAPPPARSPEPATPPKPAAGQPEASSPAASLNQKVLDQLSGGATAGSETAPADMSSQPASAAMTSPAKDQSGEGGTATETSSATIDLRSPSDQDRASSSMPPGPRRTQTAARPSRVPTAAPERPATAGATIASRADGATMRDSGAQASVAAPRSASAPGVATLPKGSTTARLNALMLGGMSAPAQTAAPASAPSPEAVPERPSTPAAAPSSAASAAPAKVPTPAGTKGSDTTVIWDKQAESAASGAEPAIAATATEMPGAPGPGGRDEVPDSVSGGTDGMPKPSATPSVRERPAPESASAMSRSLNAQSLAALSPKPEGGSTPAETLPNLREEMRSRGGMVAALPLPKNPESLTLDDGTVYYGDLRDNLPHGTGRLVYKDGSIYVGSFQNGQRSGHGVLEMSGGWRYEGEFENNRYDGLGEMSWPDGATYVGAFSNGERTGRGVYWWPNGAKYEGNFVAGEPDGIGTYFYPDGRAETGTWKKGELVSAS